MHNTEQLKWRFLAAAMAFLFTQEIVFFLIAVSVQPTPTGFGLFYVTWMILPALSAAALASNGPLRGVGAILITLVSVALFNGLILSGWGLASEMNRVWQAIGLSVTGLVMSVICAGFVEGIVHYLDNCHLTGRRNLISAGLRKGASFGALCAGIAAVTLFLGGPAATSESRRADAIAARQLRQRHWAMNCAAGFVLGTLCGVGAGGIAGSRYRPPNCTAS